MSVTADLDARAFLWHADPATFAHACGFRPDPWQLEALRSAHRQLAFNCSRQSGKTTTTAVLAAREAVLYPGSLTLVYARAQRQAVELLRKVKDALAALGEAAPPLTRDNEQDVELATGARVLALPSTEHTTRGFSAPRLVVFDEAARVSDELYFAVRPMLAVSQGRLILLSSSWNANGFFYEVMTAADPSWHRIRVPAAQCPRLDAAWLEEERAAIGHRAYRREYELEFGATDESVFDRDIVDRFFSSPYPPLYPPPLRRVA